MTAHGSLREEAARRLSQLGCEVAPEDASLLETCAELAGRRVADGCGTSEVPEGLRGAAADRACGEFLLRKRNSGGLSLKNTALERAVKTVSEGDLTVTFADGASDADRLDALIGHLLKSGEGELSCYRKIRW